MRRSPIPPGHWADKYDKRLLLAFGYSLGVATALLLAFGGGYLSVLVVAFVLSGLYVGMEETLEDFLAAELLIRDLRGTGFGTMAVFNGGVIS